jgi:hypothetical protein
LTWLFEIDLIVTKFVSSTVSDVVAKLMFCSLGLRNFIAVSDSPSLALIYFCDSLFFYPIEVVVPPANRMAQRWMLTRKLSV